MVDARDHWFERQVAPILAVSEGDNQPEKDVAGDKAIWVEVGAEPEERRARRVAPDGSHLERRLRLLRARPMDTNDVARMRRRTASPLDAESSSGRPADRHLVGSRILSAIVSGQTRRRESHRPWHGDWPSPPTHCDNQRDGRCCRTPQPHAGARVCVPGGARPGRRPVLGGTAGRGAGSPGLEVERSPVAPSWRVPR